MANARFSRSTSSGPLQHQTWEKFSANWNTDVRMAFHRVRETLLKPLRPGSRVVVMSSGAALQGSPLSGGHAGAKATQRFIAAYAQQEADLAGLGLTFTSIPPRITLLTDLGRPAVQAYAERSGQSEEEYMAQMGPPVTPDAARAAVVELVQADPGNLALPTGSPAPGSSNSRDRTSRPPRLIGRPAGATAGAAVLSCGV